MTASRRNKLAAIGVFALLVGVLCGGIAWATVASLELTKNNILAEHDRHVREAVSKLDGYMNGVLNAETAREYKEYRSQYLAQAVAVWSQEGREQDAIVELPSPLASRTNLQPWIDVYFQINPEGEPTSPQVPEEGTVLPRGRSRMEGCDPRVCRTWAWLTTKALPGIDLQRLAADGDIAPEPEPDPDLENVVADSQKDAEPPRKLSPAEQLRSIITPGDYKARKRRYEQSRVEHLPPHECVPQHIADANVLQTGTLRVRGVYVSYLLPDVELRTGRFLDPFWLEPEPEEGPKLAFIRRVYHDDNVFFQGFVGDWTLLRETLLEQIKELFPEVDLRIAAGTVRSDTKLVNLPVELVVPDVTEQARAAAWSSIGGMLIATWLVAGGVLMVAGLGLRNLVALTERRMQFAYAVTHELRTPLTTFRLYTDMLAAGLVPGASKQEYLETLNRESQRLSSLVEDVLEYARLENQKIRLQPVETDAAALLSMIADAHAERCASCGLEAKTENAVVNGQKLYTDVDAVNRIAAVLINNACRHAAGVEQGTVLLKIGTENGHIHLDVIDSGPGIDRADAHQIFKPFRRGHNVDKKAHGGVGLGLALARSWATMLGGRLELAARHDAQLGGAHFRLTIPSRSAASA